MTKVKVLQATNIEGVDRAIGDIVEIADASLAEVLIKEGLVAARSEEQASAKTEGTNAAPAAGEGEAASA